MDGSQAEMLPAIQNRLSETFDIRTMIATFRRRLKLFLAVAVLIFVPVVLFTLQATPRYTASASVMLDVRQENVVDMTAVMSGLPADSSVVDTEVEVLRSRALAERVVNKLKLDDDPEFNTSLNKPGLIGQLKEAIGGVKADDRSRAAVQKRHEQVVDAVLSRLSIRRSGLTYLINVGFTSESPLKAQQIANSFAELYLREQLEAKFEATQQANTWLNERLGELRGQVQAAELAVQQYRISNNLMSADGATLTEQEISTLNTQLAATRVQEAEQRARLEIARRQLATGSSGDDVGEALGSKVIQDLRASRSAKSAEVANLAGRYGERHPELLKAKRELSDIDQQIQAEIGRVMSNLEAQAQIARQRTASLEGSVSRSRGALAGSNRASVRLQELERNAQAVRTLYESFLNRFKETSAQQGIEQSDARVLSQARIPTAPSYPNTKLNFALGLVLAIGGGIAAIVVAELLSSGFGTAEEVEQGLDMPALGSIPTLASTLDDVKGAARNLSPVDFVVERPLSSFAESFRNLRASVMLSRVGERVQVVAVTSSLPGEGKTTTTISLARTLAIAGSSVVIVDCDLRQRSVNSILAGEPTVGLLEVLSGAATLEQALIKDEATGVMILPLARSAYTPKDVFGTDVMRRLINELRGRFEYVLLDTAPVLPIADTRILAPLADVVVVLARWRKTHKKAVQATLRLLGSAHVGGVCLTQVDMKAQSRYGYGDPGYYYKSYRKYYG